MEINTSPIVTTNQDKPEGVSQSSSSAEAVLTQNDTMKPNNSEMTESDKVINSENSRMILGATEESKSHEPCDSNIDDSTATSSSCKQLLAIANVLILARRIAIPHEQEFISANQLMEYYILSEAPKVSNYMYIYLRLPVISLF